MVKFLDTALSNALMIARRAGAEIIKYKNTSGSHPVASSYKLDSSVVTAADLASHHCIIDGLKRLYPQVPCLSEEDEPEKNRVSREAWSPYWLIDPLDGTRGFIAQSPQFTVNIALIDRGRPIIGVIYAPALDQCYYASETAGAWSQEGTQAKTPLQTKAFDQSDYHLLLGHYTPPSQQAAFAADPSCRITYCHSALKMAWIAAGLADVYPRHGKTSTWDTAAGQCILEQAGGALVDFSGQPLQYNAQTPIVNPPFVALGDASEVQAIIATLNRRNPL